jgi:cyanophycinase
VQVTARALIAESRYRCAMAPALAFVTVLLAAAPPVAAISGGPQRGTLIVDGGGAIPLVVERFHQLAGGREARIVCFPTGASKLKFGAGGFGFGTILDPDWPRDRSEWAEYERYLSAWFNVPAVTLLHTRDRQVADSASFVEPIRKANAVFLAAGNAGRIAAAYLGTRTQREVLALLDRGGVVFGSSAGAIIQGSYTVRGRWEKPLLMAKGSERGLGLLRNVAINPHLTSAKRENELIDVVDAHPELLGIGIDDDAALVVQGDRFEVIGKGRVAIYDNQKRDGTWYYWLNPGDRFDLKARRKLVRAPDAGVEAQK